MSQPAATERSPKDLPLNAMTVDVEDYFHVEAFRSRISSKRWDEYPVRFDTNTRRILDLFDRFEVKATFFVLGWAARKRPEVVRDIVARGHEVGCHSYWHRLVYSLEPKEFRDDLREATHVLEDITQKPLAGYRAPSYSIVKRSLWALEILAEEGYRYDSSIFPMRHDLYGLPSFPRNIVRVELGEAPEGAGVSRTITEFPPSTLRVLGMTLPGPGGGYLRIFPLRYSLWALGRLGRRDRMPGSVYVHPWEVDPEQPRVKARWRSRLRHYTGLRRTAQRLERIIQTFRFAPMGEVLAANPPERAVTLESFRSTESA